MKHILLFSLSFFCFSIFANATELKGSPEELRKFLHPQKRTVGLNGFAERRVYANQAIVSVLVKNEAKTLSKAMADNKTLRDKLTSQLMAAGIAEKDIKNSKFSSSPQYGWFGNKPSSFEVNNRVSITVESESSLQALADVTDQYEELSIVSTEYKDTKKDELHEELKKEAMAKVLKDKSYFEKSLNVSLTTISFSDSGLRTGASMGELEMVRVKAARTSRSDSMTSSYQAEPKPATSFEEIMYSTSVYVEYEVGDNIN